ncbi:MAG: biotin/lipoyl-binding protein, partial [Thermoguttaceae bacterium]|nr:biotin/lipoyl-binding protein [Thermoguttaceae bacterium]
MRRPWVIAVAVVAAAGALWLALVGFDSGVPVETAEVVAGPIGQYVDEQAITRLPETYLITMPIAGRIEPIRLIEGAPVRQGQVVARIVERDLELAVQEARAAVERLDAAIEENAYNRVEETAHEQMQQFVESTKATVEAAKARMEAGQARHDYAERNLSRMQRLVEQNAASQDQVDRAMVDKVEA